MSIGLQSRHSNAPFILLPENETTAEEIHWYGNKDKQEAYFASKFGVSGTFLLIFPQLQS
jgi:hypothetical protein